MIPFAYTRKHVHCSLTNTQRCATQEGGWSAAEQHIRIVTTMPDNAAAAVGSDFVLCTELPPALTSRPAEVCPGVTADASGSQCSFHST
jgi:hypothetical protein